MGLGDKAWNPLVLVEVDAIEPVLSMYRAALKRAGVKASEAMHVGDQYHADVLGARRWLVLGRCLNSPCGRDGSIARQFSEVCSGHGWSGSNFSV